MRLGLSADRSHSEIFCLKGTLCVGRSSSWDQALIILKVELRVDSSNRNVELWLAVTESRPNQGFEVISISGHELKMKDCSEANPEPDVAHSETEANPGVWCWFERWCGIPIKRRSNEKGAERLLA